MDWLTRVVAGVLQRWARRLPADRRDWAEAVWAEAGHVAVGRRRMSRLLGGVMSVARQTGMVRSAGRWLMVALAGLGTVVLSWHPGSTNPGAPVDRMGTIAVVVALAGLPWAVRRAAGPVGQSRVVRMVRIWSYTALCALVVVLVGLSRFAGSRFDDFHAFNQANWDAEMVRSATAGAVVLTALVSLYATGILATTAQRSRVAPRTLAFGATSGVAAALMVYASAPLGSAPAGGGGLTGAFSWTLPLVMGIPVAAGAAAARRAPVPDGRTTPSDTGRLRQGVVAGWWAGSAGAVLVAVLTVGTMLVLPRHVKLEWANPDPTVPHGTPYEVQMSVGDGAVKYEGFLVLGPLIGAIGGAVGAGVARRPRPEHHGRPSTAPQPYVPIG